MCVLIIVHNCWTKHNPE